MPSAENFRVIIQDKLHEPASDVDFILRRKVDMVTSVHIFIIAAKCSQC